jgi:hypothetical protein
MNRALVVIMVLFSFSASTDAQWTNRSCGVADLSNCTTAEFECLWEKASMKARRGAISTGIGTSCIVTGLIIISQSTVSCTFGICVPDAAGLVGGLVFFGGIIVDFVAIPTWITGGYRKAQLRNHPHFKSLNLEALKLSPTIIRNQFNNTYSAGLSATFSF